MEGCGRVRGQRKAVEGCVQVEIRRLDEPRDGISGDVLIQRATASGTLPIAIHCASPGGIGGHWRMKSRCHHAIVMQLANTALIMIAIVMKSANTAPATVDFIMQS